MANYNLTEKRPLGDDPNLGEWTTSPDAIAIFDNQLTRQRNNPPDEDSFVSYFCGAAQELLTDDAQLEFFRNSLELRHIINPKPLSPLTFFNQYFRVIHKQIIDFDPDYPNPNYLSTETYVDALKTVFEDPIRRALAITDMARDVQSNRPSRYAVSKLVMLSETKRLGPGIRYLDIGSSALLGPDYLVNNLPFEPIVFGHLHDDDDSKRGDQVFVHHQSATEVLNSALEQDLDIAEAVAVDPVALDHESLAWINACSNRPLEMFRMKLVGKPGLPSIGVMPADKPGITFFEGKLSRQGIVDTKSGSDQEEIPLQSFDVITAQTFLYLQTKALQRESVSIMQRYLAEGGILLLQDYVKIKMEAGEPHLIFKKDDWPDYSNTTYAFGLDKHGEALELFRAHNGRHQKIGFGKDFDKLAIAREIDG